MTRPVLFFVGGLAVATGVFMAVGWGLDRRRDADELRALQDDLQTARWSIQTCQGDLASREAAFQEFNSRLNALREGVRELESLDGPGVPADQYDDYLALFDSYNDSVRVWEGRSESLRARETACRNLVERHNILVDSLRLRVEASERR